MSRESPPPDDVLDLVRAFAGFGQGYFKWVKECFKKNGVSFARMKLLGVLHASGPKIMSELSEDLGVTARNVTALVDALEGEGLVRRVPHATDRRATVIELTSKGTEHGSQMATGVPLEAIGELFRGLTSDERKQLLELVTKLHGLLAERGYGYGSPCGPGGPPAEESEPGA